MISNVAPNVCTRHSSCRGERTFGPGGVVFHVMYESPFFVSMTKVLDGVDGRVPYSLAYRGCADGSDRSLRP